MNMKWRIPSWRISHAPSSVYLRPTRTAWPARLTPAFGQRQSGPRESSRCKQGRCDTARAHASEAPTQRLRRGRSSAAVLMAVFLAGCGVETVVQDLDEKEANKIIELLADNDIEGVKQLKDTGREIRFAVAVPGKQRLQAIRLLNKHELPRRQAKGYNEVFKESGLIPTSAEEKAKKLAALEGEIERQIKLIEGVLDVQVQIVLPEQNPLRTTQDQQPPTTASVTVKYLPGSGGARPVSEPEVQALVAAGVEKLAPEDVVVLMRPSGQLAAETPVKAQSMNPEDRKRLVMFLAGALALVVIFGIILVYTHVRLRTVRGRLVRLQTEIAKARRRSGDEPAA